MDWIRNNKFMSGFLGFMLVAAGALGYLLFAQMGTYDQTSQDYDSAVKELDRLQNLKPYPFARSKGKLIDLRKETAQRVTDLQKQLADYEPPAERSDFKPIEFQDKLRHVVDEISQAAKSANIALPADFYMGFEQYRGTPPDAAAAPALSRELDAIEDLLKILINRRIDALTLIKRAPLPQEPGGAGINPSAAAATARNTPGGRPAATALADSVSRYPVELDFTCQPSSFRDSLDDIVTAKRLFLVRAVQVKNQKSKGPPREGTGASAPAPTPQTAAVPDPGTAAPAPADTPAGKIEYIVGLEKLDVNMRVEIIKVAPPATVAAR